LKFAATRVFFSHFEMPRLFQEAAPEESTRHSRELSFISLSKHLSAGYILQAILVMKRSFLIIVAGHNKMVQFLSQAGYRLLKNQAGYRLLPSKLLGVSSSIAVRNRYHMKPSGATGHDPPVCLE